LVAIFSLPTLVYLSFQIPSVQRYAVKEISLKLSAYFESRVTFSEISFIPISRLVLKDFCIYAKNNDTVLYSPRLVSGINIFTIRSKTIALRTISLQKPLINFYIDSTRTINFLFIVDKLVSKDTTQSGSGFEFGINRVRISNGTFLLHSFYKTDVLYGINFTDLVFNNLTIDVSNFKSKNGITSFRFNKFSGKEKSGFELINFTARTIIDKNNLAFNGVSITTNLSQIDANQIRLNFSKFKDLGQDFIHKVKMFVDLNLSKTSTDDIAYFAPKLKEFHFNAEVSGKITGKITGLKGRNISLKFGSNSYLNGNADINGLPDFQSSFLYLDVQKFYSNPSDLERITLPNSKSGHLDLPKIFDRFTYLSYTGKFSGFINDFVAYGLIQTNLGKINSDISIRPDTSNSFSFKGKVKATEFDLGYLLDKQKLIGKISFNAMLNGKNTITNQISAKMDGEISSFYLKKYNYQNIKINGTLSNNTYDGTLNIVDPNIELSFLGKVNLSKKTPEFNFSAKLERANLYKLNLDTLDTASFVSMYATADFAGKNIDDLDGEIKLWNSTLRKTGKEIQINDFLLFTKNINETKRIILRSNLVDAEIWGTYQFSQLGRSFQWLMKHYLPSLILNNPPEQLTLNNFSFEADFKDTRLLTDYFIPGLYISRDSKLTGDYNPSGSKMNFLFSVPFMNFKGKKVYDLYVNGKSSQQNLSLTSGCSNIRFSKQLSIDNFTLLAEIQGDSIQLTNRWNNWDSIVYKGNIQSVIAFSPSANNTFPQVNIKLAPSQIVLHDTLWKINPSIFTFDSNRLAVNHLEIEYRKQKITAEGAISRIPNDKLNITCKEVDLSVVNSFIPGNYLILGGIVNGNAELSDLYHNPYFFADLKVDSLEINDEILGNTDISAKWNHTDKSIDLKLLAMRGSINTLDVSGIYKVQTRKIDGKISLNKLKINIFQPFAKFLISDLKGLATGDLDVSGTITEPIFNGEINLQKSSFMVNYLKTRYSFTKTVKIKDDNILVNNLVLHDNFGNNCEVNGTITNKYFKDFYFDLKLKGNNFEFLNTTEKDNSMFFGKAYATGRIDIFGPPKSLTMNITAKTEPNSILSIPLGNRSGDVSEMKFVKFIDKTPKVLLPQYDYEQDQKSKSTYTANLNGLKLNINLEVTPDATAQIIFDSKIGDMIKGTGSGNIKMEINTQGKFSMFGKYTIEQGDYLFTLQNVINKHFKVVQGGTIVWNGNPVDAIINLEAIYPVRASLYDLLSPTMATGAEQYQNRIPIDCKIYLTGKLLNPNPDFKISIPNVPQETQTRVNSAISNEDERNKQFISLLVLGSFLPDPSMTKQNNSANTTASSGFNPVGSTSMEFISNQLSRWLSQINKDFDIGVNYRPENGITSQELEVMLGTQLLNDRLSINGNFDVGGTSTVNPKQNPNSIVGDVDVSYKPWKNGKLRLKAFNHSNENYIYEISPYTQGVGISYKEEFNSFGELIKKYWNGVFAKKEEEEIKPVEENDSTQMLETE